MVCRTSKELHTKFQTNREWNVHKWIQQIRFMREGHILSPLYLAIHHFFIRQIKTKFLQIKRQRMNSFYSVLFLDHELSRRDRNVLCRKFNSNTYCNGHRSFNFKTLREHYSQFNKQEVAGVP